MRRIPQATRDAAVALYASGMTGEAVAERLGVSPESVRTFVRAAGKTRPRNAPRACLALTGGRWAPRNGVQRWEPQP